MDGVSLTHEDPRKLIWTFAAALSQISPSTSTCKFMGGSSDPPEFVDTDYFCDSGHDSCVVFPPPFGLLLTDPLWDGAMRRMWPAVP